MQSDASVCAITLLKPGGWTDTHELFTYSNEVLAVHGPDNASCGHIQGLYIHQGQGSMTAYSKATMSTMYYMPM